MFNLIAIIVLIACCALIIVGLSIGAASNAKAEEEELAEYEEAAEEETERKLANYSSCPKCDENIANALFKYLSEVLISKKSAKLKCPHCSFMFEPDIEQLPVLGGRLSIESSKKRYLPTYDMLLHIGGYSYDEWRCVWATSPKSRRDDSEAEYYWMPLMQSVRESAPLATARQPAGNQDALPIASNGDLKLSAMGLEEKKVECSSTSQPTKDSANRGESGRAYW